MGKTLCLFLSLLTASCWGQISVENARMMPLGSTVTISGTVTNGAELGSSRFLEDGTAGIACFPGTGSVPNFTPQRGEIIEVTGQLSEFNGLLQLNPVTGFSILGSGNAPKPRAIKASEVGERTEGQLVRFDHTEFFNKGLFFTSNTWRFTALGRSSQIYLGSGHGLIGSVIPDNFLSLVGIVSQFDQGNGTSGYQILPRDVDDLLLTTPVQMTTRVKQRNTTNSSFEIYWTTNVPSGSVVEYGPSILLGNTIADPTLVTDHSMTVSGLPIPGLWQHLRVGSVIGLDTIWSTTNLHTTMRPSSGEVRTWFSQPVDNSVSQGTNAIFLFDALDDTLVAYIDRAQTTLDVAMYNSTNATVISAVNAAWSRGVQVRFIAEAQNVNSALGNLNQSIPLFFRTDGLGSGMHNKFVVIDAADDFDAWVLQGSSNWTGSLFGDANNQFAIQSGTLADVYTAEFNEMWGGNTGQANAANSRFGPNKRENTPHFFTIGGTEVECYFSPTEAVTDRLIEVVKEAVDEVHFAAFSFTEDNLRNAMIARQPNLIGGVHGMIDQIGGSELFTLQSAGLDVVSVANISGLLHHKYLIADRSISNNDPTVITGSHNFSFNAARVNDENVLIFHDGAIADQFYQDWVARRDAVVGITEIVQHEPSVFPNPTTGLLHLRMPVAASSAVQVFDIAGQWVKQVVPVSGVIDLSDLAPGTYLLDVHTEVLRRQIRVVRSE